jgi:group I intron endonuclease
MYLAKRVINHILNNTNIQFKHAIKMYGLENFNVIIVEYVEINKDVPVKETKKALFSREQHWLNWLFTHPKSFFYNFLPIAGYTLGLKLTLEQRDKLSAIKSGTKHPNYGKIAFNVVGTHILALDGDLVATFSSRMAAAKWLGISQPSVTNAIKRGSIIKSQISDYF